MSRGLLRLNQIDPSDADGSPAPREIFVDETDGVVKINLPATLASLAATAGYSVDPAGGDVPLFGSPGMGSGDVVGPAGATAGNLAVFSGATGKVVADGGPVPAAYTPPTGTGWVHVTLGAQDAAASTPAAADVGLGNCDNTSDANKPVSTAQRNAINDALSSCALRC